MTDILIDSSSLFLVMKTEESTLALIEKVKNSKDKIRILFSPLVFEEMLDHGDKNLVTSQLLRVGEIANALGEAFGWALSPDDAFLREIKGLHTSTPVVDKEIAQKFLSYFSDQNCLMEFVKSYTSQPQTWKTDRLKADEQVQTKGQEKAKKGNPILARDNIIKFIESYSGTSAKSPLLMSLIRDICENKKCFIMPEDVVRQPLRYPFLYAWACLADLTGLGLGLPRDDPHEIGHKLRPDKGNWYDNSLGATAALCKILVTQDRGLMWKCNHLFKKGLIRFFAQTLKDFLDSKNLSNKTKRR